MEQKINYEECFKENCKCFKVKEVSRHHVVDDNKMIMRQVNYVCSRDKQQKEVKPDDCLLKKNG